MGAIVHPKEQPLQYYEASPLSPVINRRQLLLAGAAALARARTPEPFGASFTDVGEKAGLIHPVVYGGIETKKYILETNGCGIAFFDYDND
ncbi:MAG TPA: hypothetical protein VFA04_14510, partial [Bryobacteraceae bacterium]|nr:hypothetical protein [Bryobacteraceae bacterium]